MWPVCLIIWGKLCKTAWKSSRCAQIALIDYKRAASLRDSAQPPVVTGVLETLHTNMSSRTAYSKGDVQVQIQVQALIPRFLSEEQHSHSVWLSLGVTLENREPNLPFYYSNIPWVLWEKSSGNLSIHLEDANNVCHCYFSYCKVKTNELMPAHSSGFSGKARKVCIIASFHPHQGGLEITFASIFQMSTEIIMSISKNPNGTEKWRKMERSTEWIHNVKSTADI